MQQNNEHFCHFWRFMHHDWQLLHLWWKFELDNIPKDSVMLVRFPVIIGVLYRKSYFCQIYFYAFWYGPFWHTKLFLDLLFLLFHVTFSALQAQTQLSKIVHHSDLAFFLSYCSSDSIILVTSTAVTFCHFCIDILHLCSSWHAYFGTEESFVDMK